MDINLTAATRASRSGHGNLLLVAVLAAVSVGAARAGTGAADLVEMEVLGVIPLESETASLLILRQKGARTVLPIFVGKHEGDSIEQRLKHSPTHPHGPDLLARSIDALGGKVSRVSIDGAHTALFSARVTLEQGERRVDVEARPSDSVALAIASNAPIYATRHVVAEAGLSEDDLAHAGTPGKAHGPEERRSRAADRPDAGPEESF